MRLIASVFAALLLGPPSLFAAFLDAVVPLWLIGAPGSEVRKNEAERIDGKYVSNIHNPSLWVYLPPAEMATGCAVIVAPGGGHARLAIEQEGIAVARRLADQGVAAFVLKYRLSNDDATPTGTPQPYTTDRDALADAQRAIRIVRSRASEWGINPTRVGMIGFCAGGEVTMLAATRGRAGKPEAVDSVERQSSKLDFFALIYPGGLARTDLGVNRETPPAFLLCGAEDRPAISELLPEFYLKCKRAGVPADLHIYANAGQGTGVREKNFSPSGTWIYYFHEWLDDRGFLVEIATTPGSVDRYRLGASAAAGLPLPR